MPLGSVRTAAAHFRHDPPTEAEIENAIQEVEDVVMPLHRRRMVLPIEAMESLFDRLAAVVTGSTARRQGLPGGGEFAATLLILREFMHHLKFSSITWMRS